MNNHLKTILKYLAVLLLGILIAYMTLFIVNVGGEHVPPSLKAPTVAKEDGATAICSDLMYSYSISHSGTCNGHGGVKEWIQ